MVEQLDNVNGPPGTGAASSAGAYADIIQTSKGEISGTVTIGGGSTFWGVMAVVLNVGTEEVEEFGYTAGVGWQVNVTVPTFEDGLKDLFVNATYDGNTANDTQTNAVNYGAADTCSCPSPAANWDVDASDNCDITTNCDINNYALTINGAGTFSINANITVDQFAYEVGIIIDNIPNDNKELRVKT